MLTGCGDDNNDPYRPDPEPTASYTVSNFGGSQVATLVVSNYSESEDNDVDITAYNKQATDSKRLTRGASASYKVGSRDLPLEYRLQEQAQVHKVNAKKAITPGVDKDVNTLYTDMAEGETTQIWARGRIISGEQVTVQKLHENAETSSVIVFGEVVDGTCVADKNDALTIDEYFGISNPQDPTDMAIGTRVRQTFGSEWRTLGGRDGTEKVIIMLLSSTTMGGEGSYGYFARSDEYSKADWAKSNEGEILYINALGLADDGFDAMSTIAHEFQHMCSFNQKACHDGLFDGETDLLAIDEGQAVLAEDVTGYGLDCELGASPFVFNAVSGFLAATNEASVLDFSAGSTAAAYGTPYLFLRYIADQYGLSTITEIATSPNTGAANIASATGHSFQVLIQNWGLANILDAVSGADNLYQYATIEIGGSYRLHGEATSSQLPYVMPYDGNDSLEYTGSTTICSGSVAYIEYHDGSGYDLWIDLGLPSQCQSNLIVESTLGVLDWIE